MKDRWNEKERWKLEMKLTREEKNWILYDVGNSAFVLLVSTILPIYFNYLAEKAGLSSVDYLAYWGYAASIATLIVAVLGPILGTVADTKGFKKPLFTIALIIGAVGCIAMGFAKHWILFLILYLIAKIGYSTSLIFYDSMLPDITKQERLDYVSSEGYAWGYLGSCIPFIACLGIVLGADSIGISMELAMGSSLLIIAIWWVGMTLPLLKTYRQTYYVTRQQHTILESFHRIKRTFQNVRKEKKIFLFLFSFFFYIDGVYTIIDMATAYGSALGLNSTGLLLALLVTQFVAFPFAVLFGRLTKRFSTQELITVCITAYLGISAFACVLSTQTQFFALAVLVGMFQGGIQALSRSYYAKIIPTQQSGEYFGLMDIFGKGASFLGTTIVSAVSQLTNDIKKGIGMIGVLFVIGMILFRIAVAANDKNSTR